MTTEIHDHATNATVQTWSQGAIWSPEVEVTWEPDTFEADDGADWPGEQSDTYQTLDEALERVRHLLRRNPECCQ